MVFSRCALSDGFKLFELSEIPTSLFVYLRGAQRLPQAGQRPGDPAQGMFVFFKFASIASVRQANSCSVTPLNFMLFTHSWHRRYSTFRFLRDRLSFVGSIAVSDGVATLMMWQHYATGGPLAQRPRPSAHHILASDAIRTVFHISLVEFAVTLAAPPAFVCRASGGE